MSYISPFFLKFYCWPYRFFFLNGSPSLYAPFSHDVLFAFFWKRIHTEFLSWKRKKNIQGTSTIFLFLFDLVLFIRFSYLSWKKVKGKERKKKTEISAGSKRWRALRITSSMVEQKRKKWYQEHHLFISTASTTSMYFFFVLMWRAR